MYKLISLLQDASGDMSIQVAVASDERLPLLVGGDSGRLLDLCSEIRGEKNLHSSLVYSSLGMSRKLIAVGLMIFFPRKGSSDNMNGLTFRGPTEIANDCLIMSAGIYFFFLGGRMIRNGGKTIDRVSNLLDDDRSDLAKRAQRSGRKRQIEGGYMLLAGVGATLNGFLALYNYLASAEGDSPQSQVNNIVGLTTLGLLGARNIYDLIRNSYGTGITVNNRIRVGEDTDFVGTDEFVAIKDGIKQALRKQLEKKILNTICTGMTVVSIVILVAGKTKLMDLGVAAILYYSISILGKIIGLFQGGKQIHDKRSLKRQKQEKASQPLELVRISKKDLLKLIETHLRAELSGGGATGDVGRFLSKIRDNNWNARLLVPREVLSSGFWTLIEALE